MPVFKGFEKEDDTLVAVVDFPDAKKHTPYLQSDGTIQSHVTPFPHEERLDEDSFSKKFAGLGFDALKGLPFRESGHDMGPILQEHRRTLEAAAPASNYSVKPTGGNM